MIKIRLINYETNLLVPWRGGFEDTRLLELLREALGTDNWLSGCASLLLDGLVCSWLDFGGGSLNVKLHSSSSFSPLFQEGGTMESESLDNSNTTIHFSVGYLYNASSMYLDSSPFWWLSSSSHSNHLHCYRLETLKLFAHTYFDYHTSKYTSSKTSGSILLGEGGNLKMTNAHKLK